MQNIREQRYHVINHKFTQSFLGFIPCCHNLLLKAAPLGKNGPDMAEDISCWQRKSAVPATVQIPFQAAVWAAPGEALNRRERCRLAQACSRNPPAWGACFKGAAGSCA